MKHHVLRCKGISPAGGNERGLMVRPSQRHSERKPELLPHLHHGRCELRDERAIVERSRRNAQALDAGRYSSCPVLALFHASELSSAQSSSVSNIAISSDGSSSLRNTPGVALMIPAPMRAMSDATAVEAVMTRSPERESCAGRAWVEGDGGGGCEDHVGPAPRLIVDERPAMTGPRRILGKQDVTGMRPEVPALARLEIQRAAQRDDELARRCGVPGERAARFRLLKGDAGRCQLAGQQVAALARIESDVPFLEVRLLVIAGPQVNASDHGSTPGPVSAA